DNTTARRRARIDIGQDRQSECRQNFSGDFTETDAIAIAVAPACDRESVSVFEQFAGLIRWQCQWVRAAPGQLEHASARLFGFATNRSTREQLPRLKLASAGGVLR